MSDQHVTQIGEAPQDSEDGFETYPTGNPAVVNPQDSPTQIGDAPEVEDTYPVGDPPLVNPTGSSENVVGENTNAELGETMPAGDPPMSDGSGGDGSDPATSSEVDYGAMTRDELYAEAQRLEIEGRSDMTKDELELAVRRANA